MAFNIAAQLPGGLGTINEQFFDALLRHQIGLLRLSGSMQKEVSTLLNATELDIADKIRGRLATHKGLNTPADVRRLQTLLKSIKATRLKAWSGVNKLWLKDLRELALAEPGFTDLALKSVVPTVLETALPSVSLLKGIVNTRPFQGKTLRQWSKSVARADLDRIEAQIKIGMVQGESSAAIARRVVGTKLLKGRDGVTEMARRQTAAITRTAVNAISNQTRREFFRENKAMFAEERYVATLDNRTTPICQSLDGTRHPVAEGPIPPLHLQCRSLRVAVLDGEAIGSRPMRNFTEPQMVREFTKARGMKTLTRRSQLPRGTKGKFDKFRAKRVRELTGRAPAKVTYQEWLKRQSRAFQDDVLGKTKGRLFRKGGLKLDKFVDAKGRTLTLAQLKTRELAAFQKAGLVKKTPSVKKVVAPVKPTGPVLTKNDKLANEVMGGDKLIKLEATRLRAKLIKAEGRDFGLTDTELVSIDHYSGVAFKGVNNALRRGLPSPGLQALSSSVRSGIAKMPVQRGMVYRGMGPPNLQTILKQYKVGDTITDPAFLSTTTRRNVAAVFADSLQKVSSKQIMFAIQSKTGARIMSAARMPNELEVLFKPGTRFRVLDISKNRVGRTMISMEEI